MPSLSCRKHYITNANGYIRGLQSSHRIGIYIVLLRKVSDIAYCGLFLLVYLLNRIRFCQGVLLDPLLEELNAR